jgi:hypothetical protein
MNAAEQGRPLILEVRPGNDGMHERTPWAGTAAAAATANAARDAAVGSRTPGSRALPLYWWANGSLKGERVREPAASLADAEGGNGLRSYLGNELGRALAAVAIATGCRARVSRETIAAGIYRYACAGTGGRYVIAHGLGGEEFAVHAADGAGLAVVATLAAALEVAYRPVTPPGDGPALQSSGDVL